MSVAPLQVEIEEIEGGYVAHVSGDAGMSGVEELQRHLTRLAARRDDLVVLDLGGLSFIASLGMGQLVDFHRGISRRGGKLRLAAVRMPVRTAFERARLHELFEIHDTVQEATSA